MSNNNNKFCISCITCTLSKPLVEMLCLLMMPFTTSKIKTHMPTLSQLNNGLFNKLIFIISPMLKPQFQFCICNPIFKKDNACIYNGCFDKRAFI